MSHSLGRTNDVNPNSIFSINYFDSLNESCLLALACLLAIKLMFNLNKNNPTK